MLNYGKFTKFVFCGFLLKKKIIPARKEEKKWQMKDSLLQQNFKENSINMSQPAALCRNKVQAEIKEEIELCRDKEFFCCDIAKEECEEVYRDTLYSVTTLIKANGRGTFSQQSLLCCNIKNED